MPNVVLIKNNKVVSIVFKVDADTAALSDTANIGDIYDPAVGSFSPYTPPILSDISVADQEPQQMTPSPNDDPQS